jgi:hypothetical protein
MWNPFKVAPTSPESDAETEKVVSMFRQRYSDLSNEDKAIVSLGLSLNGKIKVTKAATVCKALGMFDKGI